MARLGIWQPCSYVIDPTPMVKVVDGGPRELHAVSFQPNIGKDKFERALTKMKILGGRGWFRGVGGVLHAPVTWTDLRVIPLTGGRLMPRMGEVHQGLCVFDIENYDRDFVWYWPDERDAREAAEKIGWHQLKGSGQWTIG